ncbi:MAG: ABC transporter ATP-binding protein [Acidimicrobiales bacterium]
MLLEVSEISIRFGGLVALHDVSLKVGEWEIVGLIGPNGAGKTTTFNCLSGFYKPDVGHIRYRGEDVTELAPHQRVQRGIGRTFQNVGMVKDKTALENLLTAQHIHAGYPAVSGILGTGQALEAERELVEQAELILDLLGLGAIRDAEVGSLPYGQLKLLELGCALATDPDLLMLDEPSSGMGPEEARQLGERLLDLRHRLGLTLLVIEHHVPLVTAICDYVYVLNFGEILAEGEASLIQTHPEVVAAYLGGAAAVADEPTAEHPVVGRGTS